MLGVDLYMNSHFDDWIVNVTAWRPGAIDEGTWAVPHFCKQSEAEVMQRHHLDSSLAMEVARQMPNAHFGTSIHLSHDSVSQALCLYTSQGNGECFHCLMPQDRPASLRGYHTW